MNRTDTFQYLQGKLASGAHLASKVLEAIGEHSIGSSREVSLEGHSSNPSIGKRRGMQLTSVLVEEVAGLHDWVIVLEDSLMRCTDSGFKESPPPPGCYFCHTNGLFLERLYFFIQPETLRDSSKAAAIIDYAANAWQNIGLVLEKRGHKFWAQYFFGDNRDLDSIVFISLKDVELASDDFTARLEIAMARGPNTSR